MKRFSKLLGDVFEMTFQNNAGDEAMKEMCQDLVSSGAYTPDGLFKAATDCKDEYARRYHMTKWELREDVVFSNLTALAYYACTM